MYCAEAHRARPRCSEMNSADRTALSAAQSWIDWARTASCGNVSYECIESGPSLLALGHMLQAACERPQEFAQAFAPVLGPAQTNPLTRGGEGALLNLVSNGIFDDLEIFLQWRDGGYVVVREQERQPEDTRFRFNEARRLLDTLTGGQRHAPGEADEAALVQSMFEAEPGRAAYRCDR